MSLNMPTRIGVDKPTTMTIIIITIIIISSPLVVSGIFFYALNCDWFLDEHIKKQKITVEVKHLDDNGNNIHGIDGDFVVVIGDGGGVKNVTYTSNKNDFKVTVACTVGGRVTIV
ncbi:hypothetical protein QTP88_013373 [Uroleucon formosanum]